MYEKKVNFQKNKIVLGSVFSGIGAFEQALKKLKIFHKTLFACDIDKFVKKSYQSNYKFEKWYDDIKEINGLNYSGKIDLLVGGSPCQSFSIAGYRKGLEDARGNLVFEFIRLLKEIKPKVFVFENVKGMLSNNKGRTWGIIEKEFKSANYKIYSDVLDAKDYEIPQSRKRLFVVGFLDKNVNFKFPKKIPLKYKLIDFLDKNFEKQQALSKKAFLNISNKERIKKGFTQINGKVAICQSKNQQSNLRGDFVSENYLKNFVLSERLKKTVLKKGKPDPKIAKTILATNYKYHYASRDNYVTVKNDKIRRLTPRECLRLMGFPESFDIVVSNNQIYKQSGNSIVVNVLEQIFLEIQKTKVL